MNTTKTPFLRSHIDGIKYLLHHSSSLSCIAMGTEKGQNGDGPMTYKIGQENHLQNPCVKRTAERDGEMRCRCVWPLIFNIQQ